MATEIAQALTKEQVNLVKAINKRANTGGRIRIESLPLAVAKWLNANPELITLKTPNMGLTGGDNTPHKLCIVDGEEGESHAATLRNTYSNVLFLFTRSHYFISSYFTGTSGLVVLPKTTLEKVRKQLIQ